MKSQIEEALVDLVAAAWIQTVEAEELADKRISLFVLRCAENDFDPLPALRELRDAYREIMGVYADGKAIGEALRTRIALLEAATHN